VLACSTVLFHTYLFIAILLQFWIFIFSRPTLTSSIFTVLPGCNIVFIIHETVWKTSVLIHLTFSVHLWLIHLSVSCWAFLAYYSFTLIGCWPAAWPWI
jgi:hypothetical protein